ncbi:BtpA/SgcQ family protein [bacterium]|nr:BtpA/SgcQ family protein [candidate division CSSED10-310 bacterium]
MKRTDSTLWGMLKPVFGCVHLLPLPGAPLYDGNMNGIFERALREADLYHHLGVHGIIIENFGDAPFYPEDVPAETVAFMTAVTREIVQHCPLPVGVNVLRNDARAAMAVATAAGAAFIRVNIHMGAMVTDQGLIQGRAHGTTRMRSCLRSSVKILADTAVKHAVPLAPRPLELDILDLAERGLVDGVIITGDRTGGAVNREDLIRARSVSPVPVLVGSGTTPDNLPTLIEVADGFIVGSYFKHDGNPLNTVSGDRVREVMATRAACV